MSAAGPAFVTPHAVRRYQERIAPLAYNHALAAILHGLRQAVAVVPTGDGSAVRVLVDAPRRWQAVVSPPAAPGRLSVVRTVIPFWDKAGRE